MAPEDGKEFAEVDELIRAGWGDVPQTQIPSNWREIRPPTNSLGAYARHRKIGGLSGGTLRAVQKAIAAGHITVRKLKGRRPGQSEYDVDFEKADAEWVANTRPIAVVPRPESKLAKFKEAVLSGAAPSVAAHSQGLHLNTAKKYMEASGLPKPEYRNFEEDIYHTLDVGALSTKAVCEIAGVSYGTATRHLSRLHQKGKVTKNDVGWAQVTQAVEDAKPQAVIRDNLTSRPVSIPSEARANERPMKARKTEGSGMTTETATDIFALPEGDVVLRYPVLLSRESCEELLDWMDLVKRKLIRRAANPSRDIPEESLHGNRVQTQ